MAIGTLAQVIFITVADEDREDVIGAATEALRNYIKLLPWEPPPARFLSGCRDGPRLVVLVYAISLCTSADSLEYVKSAS
jgi:hypothetical protein